MWLLILENLSNSRMQGPETYNVFHLPVCLFVFLVQISPSEQINPLFCRSITKTELKVVHLFCE